MVRHLGSACPVEADTSKYLKQLSTTLDGCSVLLGGLCAPRVDTLMLHHQLTMGMQK